MNKKDVRLRMKVKVVDYQDGFWGEDMIGTVMKINESTIGVFFPDGVKLEEGHNLDGITGHEYGGWFLDEDNLEPAGEPLKLTDDSIPEYNRKIAQKIGVFAENKTEALKLLKKPRVETPEGIYLYGKKIEE